MVDQRAILLGNRSTRIQRVGPLIVLPLPLIVLIATLSYVMYLCSFPTAKGQFAP